MPLIWWQYWRFIRIQRFSIITMTNFLGRTEKLVDGGIWCVSNTLWTIILHQKGIMVLELGGRCSCLKVDAQVSCMGVGDVWWWWLVEQLWCNCNWCRPSSCTFSFLRTATCHDITTQYDMTNNNDTQWHTAKAAHEP